jgi:hypothetical protein
VAGPAGEGRRPTFVIGDVHGHLDRAVAVLRDAGLLDRRRRWRGADARLWFAGDLVDRGPDGIEAIDLVMRLQQEGDVHCLLGNHEAALLGAARFPDVPCGDSDLTFRMVWELNGGVPHDLERLRPEHLAWIERLPALAREGRWLLLHSDTDRYADYGSSVDETCAAVSAVLAGGDADALAGLLADLADRDAFSDPGRLRRVLDTFGGERVVHGHTPIWYALGISPEQVRAAHAYADGAALDVDHCLFAGGRGFVTELA